MRLTFTVRFVVGLHLLVLALAPRPLRAQQAAGNPFAAQQADLLRAADFHLEQAGKQLPARAPQLMLESAPQTASAMQEVLASISPARLAAAREKLLALGVDAARVFAEEGVPEQLLVIAEVESAFHPGALSRKGARGLWQFMPETARRYGLRVNQQMDERLHVARSTRAAARYLRDLHLLFGDWQLALAAYNAGEERVGVAMERAASRSYAELVRMLPEETQGYVAAVMGKVKPGRGP